jgi:hypothetical protein
MARKFLGLFCAIALMLGAGMLDLSHTDVLASYPPLDCGDMYEPNDSLSNATGIHVGAVVHASICPHNDIDVYRVEARGGANLHVWVETHFQYSQINADLFLLDENGTVLIALAGDEDGENDEDEPSFFLPVVTDTVFYIQVTAKNISYPLNQMVHYNLHTSYADPQIEVSPLSIYLDVPLGARGSEWITIKNTGSAELYFYIEESRWTATYYLDDIPWLEVEPVTGRVQGGQSVPIEVRWTAQPPIIHQPGLYKAYLLILNSSVHQWVEIQMNVSYFPVNIDIRPGNQHNQVNVKSGSALPVALLSTPGFIAPEEVDAHSLTFGWTGQEASLKRGPNAQPHCHNRDVNADGLKDLVCQFLVSKTELSCSAQNAYLRGKTNSGFIFQGSDLVRVTGCKR